MNSDDGLGSLFFGLVGVASPLWGPHLYLDDNLSNDGYFRPFPYDTGMDYMEKTWSPGFTRPLAVRLDAEYAATFDRLDNLASHLLVETAPRFGLTASWTELQQRLDDGGRDRLALGDCNLVYRFAQAGWAEFRTGCGVNWMADSGRADFGFNFTYAADFYPVKPWVLSTELDCGTLGRAQRVPLPHHRRRRRARRGNLHRLRVHRHQPGALERPDRRPAALVLSRRQRCASTNLCHWAVSSFSSQP